ncbi:SDR family oxidoreductase [Aquimarina sp. BL5]|uniref:SDR family oxidoreductase n=1 Tax=Aquimarina sp. BL5 TaxID=1714860 RepID=UPI000E475FDA|nr:SDR family oxidoreductase [Aquimarina sp. BL5]AXT52567.1 SDR family oxidoreductase [Aquimarina sp. BL5]RKN11247.1 SDR family NAD(P)-dependent oxidoreductase [Aquimarina sp. BL5]
MNLTDNITGKVIVITGASSGLGETTARHLASKGAHVVLGARREERLQTITKEINTQGNGKAVYVKTDVTKKEDVQTLVDTAVSEFGKLDVIVNNAGLMSIAPMSEVKIDEWDRMIDINVKGVLYGIASALPIFQKQESGHFINLSSVAGVKVFSPGGTVYSGTKFAVRAISEGLRHEVGGNIRTTSIEPGLIDSELKHGSSHKESSDFVKDFYQIAIPSESIARTIAFAIEQPADVDVNEIVIRPTVQDF